MIWDGQHLKALLGLPRCSKESLNQEPWSGWLRKRGGENVVRELLRQAPLKPMEAQLLEMILSNPFDPPFRRAAAFNISQGTYFRYLNTLVASLVEYINRSDEKAFPPIPAPTANLPLSLDSLIGAETTLHPIIASLAHPTVRLVTLMGTGGIGKTRLAIQTARQMLETDNFKDGVFWVDLAPLRAPDLVLIEIAQVLNLIERSGRPTLELLQRTLSDRSLLLLLDNFEHLLAAAPMVAALLQGTKRLKILVTSRAALNISGEHRLSIPPLDLPALDPLPAFEQLGNYSAIQLFVQRAQAVDKTFALTSENAHAIAQLCVELDGLPLAIELAARRINHLSPQKMLTLLGQRLQLLTGGARDVAPRHQTLRNLIDWSYQLLDADQQMVFRCLAVFANGWTLDAMEAICVDHSRHTKFDILAALINQSIIFRQSDGAAPRFGMLESIREYAQEKLAASGEEALMSQRHAAYYLSLVEAWTQVNAEPPTSITPLEREYHNLCIALQWAIDQNQPELALGLAVALWHYWTMRGSPNEGQYWLERVLALQPPVRSPKRVIVLTNMGEVALYQNEIQQAQVFYEEAALLAREFNNPYGLGMALRGLGQIAQIRRNYSQARARYMESLALYRDVGDQHGLGWALDGLGNLALDQDALEEASACFAESLTVFETNEYIEGITHARAKLGLIAFEEGRYADAAQIFESSLSRLQPTAINWHYAWLIECLGQAMLHLGEVLRAADLFNQSLRIHFEGKAYEGTAYGLHGLATVALAGGQGQRAVHLLVGVQFIFDRYPIPPPRRRQLMASLERAQEVLKPSDFNAAWREGQAMILDQIVAEGLGAPR